MSNFITAVGYLSSQLDWEYGTKTYISIVKDLENNDWDYFDLMCKDYWLEDLYEHHESKIVESFYNVFKRLKESELYKETKNPAEQFIKVYKKVNKIREEALENGIPEFNLRAYLEKSFLSDISDSLDKTELKNVMIGD